MNPKIIHQDHHWLVVDKPANWLSVPSRMGAQDERPCVGKILESETGQRLWPVHRLDFEVSGIVIFAKSPEAHSSANAWFASRQVKKTYEAWSEGAVDESDYQIQRWKSRLVRGKRRTFSAPHGQESLTDARCLGESSNGLFQWQLQPITGRSHQLRFEMARRGHPILGDTLYGGVEWKSAGIALRAISVDLASVPITERFGLPERIEIPGLKV